MTSPKIDPKTGHEPNLPDPRSRPDIYKELLASYQVDPNVHLFDLFYRLKKVVMDMEAMVQREITEIQKQEKLNGRKKYI